MVNTEWSYPRKWIGTEASIISDVITLRFVWLSTISIPQLWNRNLIWGQKISIFPKVERQPPPLQSFAAALMVLAARRSPLLLSLSSLPTLRKVISLLGWVIDMLSSQLLVKELFYFHKSSFQEDLEFWNTKYRGFHNTCLFLVLLQYPSP